MGVNQALTLSETFAAILRKKILRTTTKTLPFTGKGKKKSTEETLTLTQKKQQAGAWVPWEVKPSLCHFSKSRKVVIHIIVWRHTPWMISLYKAYFGKICIAHKNPRLFNRWVFFKIKLKHKGPLPINTQKRCFIGVIFGNVVVISSWITIEQWSFYCNQINRTPSFASSCLGVLEKLKPDW